MKLKHVNAFIQNTSALALTLIGTTQLCCGQSVSPPQGAANSSASDSRDQLGEIVVTAEKRTENVQEVPISIGVLSEAQLQREQVRDLIDIARTVPDLAVTTPGNGVPGQGNYSIRGVSSVSVAVGSGLGQTTIGVYLDDVAMPSATGAGGDTSLQVFDVSRVEVLRGPQGTLYGASAMGGTVRYISNQPDLVNSSWSAAGTLSSTKGGDINYLEQAVGNLALVDNQLALRVGVQVSSNSGFIDNYNAYTGVATPNNNYYNSTVLRASMKYQSSDGSLTILPSVFLQRLDAQGTNEALPNTQYGSQFYVPQADSDRLAIPSLTVNKDFDFANLTSTTSYYLRKQYFTIDETPFLEIPIFAVVMPMPFEFDNRTTSWTEELRLTSATQAQSGLPFDWIVGAYYADTQVKNAQLLYPQDVSTFQQLILNAYGSDVFGVFPYGSNIYTQVETLGTRQISGFGEFDYSPIKPLTATVGLRYLVAHQDATNYSSGWFNGSPIPSTYAQSFRASHVSPKFALKFDYSDNGQVYATGVNGFRLGGANQSIPVDPSTPVGAACLQDLQAIGRDSAPANYKPDSLWSYELGDKSTLFNNRMTIDFALFYISWKDVQQPITLVSPNANCDYAFGANAGKAKSDGVDLSLNAKLSPALSVYLSGNITHAEITSAAPGTGASDGAWLNGVPRWQANTGFNWSQPVGRDLEGFISADGHWIGQAHQGFQSELPGFVMPQYFLLQTNLGVNFGKWQFSLFGKNLLDNDVRVVTATRSPYYGVVLQPRTIGISVQKSM